MSPLLPKGKRPWTTDPGHIHDVPEPPPMPDEQELGAAPMGAASPLEPIEARQAAEEAREPHGEPAPVPEPSEVEVPRALAQEIRQAMKRYPQRRSAAMPALWAVQRRYGWCSPKGINQAAAVMGVTPGYLEGVASFYDLFHLEPQGEHQVLVCTNISCWLRGADRLLEAFGDAAGVEGQGTSEDGKVCVRGFECMGACDIAPMASIDERYYGPLTEEDAGTAVEQLRKNSKEILPEKRLQDRLTAGDQKPPADKRLSRHPVNKPKPKKKP